MSNEQDLLPGLTKVASEPTGKPAISRIKSLKRIVSSVTAHYEQALGTYARTPQMLGTDLTGAANHLSDKVYIEEVDIALPNPLPKWLANIGERQPIKIGETLISVRPEQQEVILVEPKPSPAPSVLVEKVLSHPQPTTFNPPYKPEWKVIEGGLNPEPAPPTQSTPISHHDTELENNPFLQPLKKIA